jgi:hypothetical protein
MPVSSEYAWYRESISDDKLRRLCLELDTKKACFWETAENHATKRAVDIV